MEAKRFSCVLTGIVFAGLLVLPLFARNPYVLHVIIRVFTVSLSALSVRLILLSGSVSLGQAAFVAIGAYTSAIVVMKLSMPTWLALPLAGLVAAGLGAAIGWPALRLRGIYFTILTLCINGAIMRYIDNLGGLTGGLKGLYGIPQPASIAFGSHTLVDFSTGKTPYYYYGLALLAFCLVVVIRVDRSRLGAIFRGLAESEPLSSSIGVPIMRYKVLAFSIGCFFCGLAGAFHAHYSLFLQSSSFGAWDSVYYLIYAIAGGLQSAVGPVLGCALMLGFFEISRPLIKFQPLVYGAVLVTIMLFAPDGLVSLLAKLKGSITESLTRRLKRTPNTGVRA
jgi:branched-chain amino acid transport system permease protein